MKAFRPRLVNACLAAILMAGLAGGLGACTKPRTSAANWQHPTLPKDAWAADFGDCRRYARREAEREAGLTASRGTSDNMSGGFETYNANMSRYELQRLQERSFADCMRRRGYVPIAK